LASSFQIRTIFLSVKEIANAGDSSGKMRVGLNVVQQLELISASGTFAMLQLKTARI